MDFIDKLRNELQKPLPGEKSQFEMASGNRIFYKEFQYTEPHRHGCVLICLYLHDAKWSVVFIKRTEGHGPHSGQMAFPGGMFEEDDEDLYAAAVREAKEEVGINKDIITFVGKLSTLHIPVSNIMVHPFIVCLPGKPVLFGNKDEVEEIIESPIDAFLDTKNHSSFTFEYKEKSYISPCFIINGFKIWGATAMIWNEFLTVYKKIVNNKQ